MKKKTINKLLVFKSSYKNKYLRFGWNLLKVIQFENVNVIKILFYYRCQYNKPQHGGLKSNII